MRLKKYLLFILLVLFLTPSVVNAENCDLSSISLSMIKINNIIGNPEEVTKASVNDKNINLNLVFHDVGDTITYDLKIKNNSKIDFNFDPKEFNLNTDYLEYKFIDSNNSYIVKGNSEKTIQLQIMYKKKVPSTKLVNNLFNDNKRMTLNLINKAKGESGIINPNTSIGGLIIYSILLVCIPIVLMMVMKTMKTRIMVLLGTTILIPITVKALCQQEIILESNIQIDGKEAVFLPGVSVNIKMKQLAGTDTSTDNSGTLDDNIRAIKYSSVEPTAQNKEEKNIVSTSDSPYPIYMWYENGTIYWWSEDKTPSLNENASSMFTSFNKLIDISGLTTMDASHVSKLYLTLSDNYSLEDLTPLKNWNTSNVTDMTGTFQADIKLEDLTPLKNWNVSNVETMMGLFLGTTSYPMHIKSLKPLSNWDVSKVTNMHALFQTSIDLETLEGLENWKTSNLTNIRNLFYNCKKLKNIDALSNWDTSNITTLRSTFYGTESLTNINSLKNWDTSKVTSLRLTFAYNLLLENIDPLINWKTSNVTDMAAIFYNCNHLENTSGIKDWDVSNVEDMSYFMNVSSDASEYEYSMLPKLEISNWNMAKVKKYDWFIESLRYVTTEITIRRTNVTSYKSMLSDCANKGGRVVINYTAATESIVDQMLTTITPGANIVKGHLVE